MILDKNKILITGATSGIGKALTKKFLNLDNKIIAVGRNEEELEKLSKSDCRIFTYKCDISKTEELLQLADFIKKDHPDLNILINNAGIQFNYSFSFEREILSKIDDEVNVNFLAPLKLTALLLPIIKFNNNSAIINISSGLGIVPKTEAPVYCATKAGIHIFSISLRYQLNEIKVFEIIPPVVDTAMTAGRGKGKISPERLVEEFIKAFQKNKFEVNIHKVKLLRIINRISPKLAEKIMKGVSQKSPLT